MSEEEMNKLADKIADRMQSNMKEILNADEAAKFLGFEKSYLYRLTSSKQIPFYKPSGKNVYFKKSELEEWILQNPIATEQSIQRNALNFCRQRAF